MLAFQPEIQAILTKFEVDPQQGLRFYQNGNTKITFPLFSAQYNAEKWSLTAEYAWIDSHRSGYSPAPSAPRRKKI